MQNADIVASLVTNICLVTSVTCDCIPRGRPAIKCTEEMDSSQIITALIRKLAVWRLPGSAVIRLRSRHWKGQNIGTTLNVTQTQIL